MHPILLYVVTLVYHFEDDNIKKLNNITMVDRKLYLIPGGIFILEWNSFC
jgi:hypothetical protein